MISKEKLFEKLDFIMDKLDGYEASITIQANSEGVTRFGNSEINKNVYEDHVKITILCSDGRSRIRVNTSAVEKGHLVAIIADMQDTLRRIPAQNQPIGLVSSPRDLSADYFNEELNEALSVKQRALLIKSALSEIKDTAFSGFGSLNHLEFQTVFGNSRNIRRYYRANTATFTALVSSQGGRSGGSTRITSTQLDDFKVVAAMRRAYQKAIMNEDPTDLDVGAYTIIMEPLAVSDLLTFLGAIAFNGPSVHAGSSMLNGRFGQRVFSDKISIVDDWTNPHTLPIPFDLEGAPKAVVPIITKGIAEGVVHDLESATKAGVPTTGHATGSTSWGLVPHNLIMANGNKPLEQMIEETDQGLLVTRFHYVNPVNRRAGILTGLTKDGLFRIEDGRLVGAAQNMRFTESMFDVLSNVVDVSREREKTRWWDPLTSYYVPALKIDNFHFTGKSSG